MAVTHRRSCDMHRISSHLFHACRYGLFIGKVGRDGPFQTYVHRLQVWVECNLLQSECPNHCSLHGRLFGDVYNLHRPNNGLFSFLEERDASGGQGQVESCRLAERPVGLFRLLRSRLSA